MTIRQLTDYLMTRTKAKRTTAELKETLYANVNKNGPVPSYNEKLGECWLWEGAMGKDGYGVIKFNGIAHRVPKVAYNLANGNNVSALSGSDVISHRCDTKQCVRPSHLKVGNHKTNALEYYARKVLST